jgi:predicted PurR-regulated permease PerM
VGLVVGLAALAWAAASVLALVFVSLLIAAALEPQTDRLRERLPTGRAGTIIVAFALFFVAVAAAGVALVPLVADEAGRVMDALPSTLEAVAAWAHDLEPPMAATIASTLVETGQQLFERQVSLEAEALVEIGLDAAGVVVALVTALGLAFFWLIERARLQRYVLAFAPEEHRADVRESWNAVTDRLGQWVRGQGILMLAMGVLAGIAYTALGVPASLLLAVIAGVTELIPIIGPILGAVPAILVAATVSPELALAVAVAYLALQAFEGLVLVPIVMRNAVGLSPFLILVSVLIGSAAGGIVGALLAVPIAATIEIVLERFQDREDPVAVDPAPVREAMETEESVAQAEAGVR